MTAAMLYTSPVEERTFLLPLRLALASTDTPGALLDGAWWPRSRDSRDLAAELPALTAVLDPLWGRITHVTVNPTLWPVIPRKVPVDGHVVSVGWFRAEQDPHKLLLLSCTVGRWDLLVIPPQTDPAIAAWLMTAATGPLRSHTASDLLERAESQQMVTEADQAREAVWDSEGGHGARVTAPARSA
ncbi:hypothetical protein JL475_29600 [Streptomyces sp. M2CJ-2]|uniref:DUF5994 family protein n=1 Tax=Streptomyces sp. M2CJ-2 TaxID=2803948 RepID=UPI001928DB8A|nr:DUF5994 family protein [Streptomyces sp. M2CJ-2]MBL3670065.1 hypothetical protein [Streptomyces sp. M2CJ-2]